MLGARLPATRWVTAASAADDNTDQWVVVQNPGDRSALVTLNVLADGTQLLVGGLSAVEVPAGQRKSFRISDSLKRAATPMLVTATESVIVERDLYRNKALGMGMAPAIPLR